MSLNHLFVYGDSLSWGIVPTSRQRLPWPQRWAGVLEAGLIARGQAVRISEDCVNGRRTVWDDPFKPGRNGLEGLAPRIEAQSPLALVLLMLGTNDFQRMHPHDAWLSAQGVAALVRAIRAAPIEPGLPAAPVLVITPPAIAPAADTLMPKFSGGAARCAGLAQAHAVVCQELGCAHFDAGQVVQVSTRDGVHLDADAHAVLGQALVPVVAELLRSNPS